MVDKSTVKLLADLSLTMFRKNFFGIYHGAISAKVDQHNFITRVLFLFIIIFVILFLLYKISEKHL